ncbi:hypothetical protein DFQ28_004193 [Apophysomyces sp. BC1034]|nr:hypothetical protein DFQ30_004262 [Apophysomyces sp. BC1015]KAG0178486.1 hypothetical protein DFQ29_003394 [Apophysomyces sp. BC1021]KAG0188883.1 hypothetical protein DFQ28_004193 [Apophysomyces sp. BC1034]
MDADTTQSSRWRRRQSATLPPSASKPPRNVDRELQRIKSLAVVSVLNKAFSPQGPTPDPTPSSTTNILSRQRSSSSLSSHHSDHRLRSQSSGHSLHVEYTQLQARRASSTFSRLKSDELRKLEEELLDMFEYVSGQNVIETSIRDWEEEVLSSQFAYPAMAEGETEASVAYRLQQLQEDYAESTGQLEHAQKQILFYQEEQSQLDQSTQNTLATWLEQKEAESAKVRKLTDVVLRQERLLCEMESSMESVLDENKSLRTCLEKTPWVETREALRHLQTEMEVLRETKKEQEQMIANLSSELEASQQCLHQTLQLAQQLQRECESQRSDIDEKLQTLTQQLLEKETSIYQYDDPWQRRDMDDMVAQDQETATNCSSRRSSRQIDDERAPCTARSSYASTMSSSGIPRPPDRPIRSSRRGSAQTAVSKRSYIARWAGGALPPAAPPPTEPLPPIPAQDDQQKTRRSMSPSGAVPIHPSAKIMKHVSVDAVSPVADSDPMDVAYREFAEQLQARLSISKEIDDLRVWQPSDLNDLQKRLESSYKDEDAIERKQPQNVVESKRNSMLTGPKDSPTFWRGMKKKLRV